MSLVLQAILIVVDLVEIQMRSLVFQITWLKQTVPVSNNTWWKNILSIFQPIQTMHNLHFTVYIKCKGKRTLFAFVLLLNDVSCYYVHCFLGPLIFVNIFQIFLWILHKSILGWFVDNYVSRFSTFFYLRWEL